MALQIWLPLDGNLTNIGLNPMTFTQANASSGGLAVDNNGKIGKCYKRTSKTTSRFRSSATINLSGDISMVCWLYIDAMDGTSA